jgi:hypothetical protein
MMSKVRLNFALEFVLPLHDPGRWRRDDDQIDAAPEQELARDKPGLDGLTEPDVIRNEKVHPRQPQRLAQWKKLIGIKPDTGAERGLQEIAVGRRRGAPADRKLARGVLVR